MGRKGGEAGGGGGGRPDGSLPDFSRFPRKFPEFGPRKFEYQMNSGFEYEMNFQELLAVFFTILKFGFEYFQPLFEYQMNN